MREFYTLLAPVLWSLKNDIIRGNLSFYRRALLYAVSMIVFIVLITWLLSAGMARLQGLSADVFNVLIIKGYALVFIIVFFIQIVNGFVIALNTYYRSRELEILLTSPVKRTSLFFSRFLETHVRASWMLAIFGVPLLVSSGLLYHAPFFYYPLSLILFVAFSTIPVDIGIGAAVIISRTFPVRTLRKILLSAGIGATVLMVTLLRLFRPERFVNPELFANLTLFINELKAPSFILLPNRWLSESVFALLGRSEGSNTAIFVCLLFLTSYISALFLQMIFKRYYYRGWELMQGGGVLKRERGHAIQGGFFTPGKLLAGIVQGLFSAFDVQSRVLLRKDLLYQIREVRNVHQIIVLLSLIVVYLFSIASLPLNWVGYTTQLRYTSSFLNLGVILIIIAGLCSRIVYPAVSSECLSFWIIKTCPATSMRYVWTKFFFFLFPLFVVGQLLTLCSSLLIGIEKPFIVLECITVALVSCSLVGMSISFGVSCMASAVDGAAEEARPGSALHMIVSVLLILATLALEVVPAYLYFLKESTQTIFTQKAWVSIAAAIVSVFLMNAFVTGISTRLSIRKIENHPS